jgi:hypothetical protein
MKIHNPFYLPFALAVAMLVAMANHNGWSLVQSVATNTWRHVAPNTQHK